MLNWIDRANQFGHRAVTGIVIGRLGFRCRVRRYNVLGPAEGRQVSLDGGSCYFSVFYEYKFMAVRDDHTFDSSCLCNVVKHGRRATPPSSRNGHDAAAIPYAFGLSL